MDQAGKLKVVKISDELRASDMSDAAVAAEMLEAAARAIRDGRMDSACWRIADASRMLRREMAGCSGVRGLDRPTGFGAIMGS